MNISWKINETKKVKKELEKVPMHIQSNYLFWKKVIINDGLETAKKQLKGARFEKLTGNRAGQYSCRLSKGYRIIFEINEKEFTILILEINKHEY